MSWNPLKILSSKHGSRSPFLLVDEGDFDRQMKNFEQLENTSKKLMKDTKKYEELISTVSRCEKKMITDLSNSLICQENDILRSLVEEWYTFTNEANNVDDNLLRITHRTLTDPIKKFQVIFSEVRSAVKRREQALQHCSKCKMKVQKLEEKEKTGDNIVKLEMAKQALENANEEFKIQDSELKKILPYLYEFRIEYFQPSLEALICGQVDYVGEKTKAFNITMHRLREESKPDYEMQQKQKQRLAAIRGLSIVADR